MAADGAAHKSANLNEMVPAMLNKEAELTLLDVPDEVDPGAGTRDRRS